MVLHPGASAKVPEHNNPHIARVCGHLWLGSQVLLPRCHSTRLLCTCNVCGKKDGTLLTASEQAHKRRMTGSHMALNCRTSCVGTHSAS